MFPKAFVDCMQNSNYGACMTQVTVRQIEEDWVDKAKAMAEQRGVLELPRKSGRVMHNLDILIFV